MSEPLKLAVIGDPVEHSQSPAIHRALLAEAGIAGTYEAMTVHAGDGARAIDELAATGYRGLNVTTPLKEEAFGRADAVDAVAQASGSVNTLVFDRGVAQGYNTDGVGAVEAVRLATQRSELEGLRVLVLGAGPTARASIVALQRSGAKVLCWNRTASRATQLVHRFAVSTLTSNAAVDVVVAALPPHADIDDDDVRSALAAAPLVIDANYGPRATLGAALRRAVIDGTAMLHASARASFHLFVSEAA